jgi:hypothetical protein
MTDQPEGEAPAAERDAEPTKRIRIDLPASLHRRFRAACAATDKSMVDEVLALIERRTTELEQGAMTPARPAGIDRRRPASVADIADALRRIEARDVPKPADAEFTEVLEKVRDALEEQKAAERGDG